MPRLDSLVINILTLSSCIIFAYPAHVSVSNHFQKPINGRDPKTVRNLSRPPKSSASQLYLTKKDHYSQEDRPNMPISGDNWRPFRPEEAKKFLEPNYKDIHQEVLHTALNQNSIAKGGTIVPNSGVSIIKTKIPTVNKSRNINLQNSFDIRRNGRNARILNNHSKVSQNYVEVIKPVYEDVNESVVVTGRIETDVQEYLEKMLKEFESKLNKILDTAALGVGNRRLRFNDSELVHSNSRILAVHNATKVDLPLSNKQQHAALSKQSVIGDIGLTRAKNWQWSMPKLYMY